MADAHDKHGDSHDSGAKHGGGGGHGHGGGGHEEHEGAPEWLISFADMVMLMMGFFVILFALNNKPAGRNPGGASDDRNASGVGGEADQTMYDLAIAVREAFNNPVDMNSTNPLDAPLIQRIIERSGRGDNRVKGVEGRESDVQSIRPSEYYAVSGSVLFSENASELNAGSMATIRDIAGKIRGMNLVVEVRGHVSSVEASRGPEASMHLSNSRALAVARALSAEGVDWWQMILISSGDHDRLEAFPASREADRANARVEIILTDRVVNPKVRTEHGEATTTASANASGR